MKLVLFALFALFAVALCQSGSSPEFKKPSKTFGFCKRAIDFNIKDSSKTIEVKAAAVCVDKNKSAKRGALVISQFSVARPGGPLSVGTPRFGMFVHLASATSNAALKSFFVLDRIIAYKDVNGIPGYQPGADTVLGMYDLRSNSWSDIGQRVTQVDADTKVYDFSSTLKPSFADEIKFGFSVSTDEVSVKNANFTTSRTVVTPNSFKVNFDITNLKWVGPNYNFASATGLAVGTFVITKGAIGKRQSRSYEHYSQSDGERVDMSTEDQEVSDIDDEDAPGKRGAFFSWKKFVFHRANATATWVRHNIISSTFAAPNATETSDANEVNIAGYTVRRIWFSTTQQVMNLNWDPAMGAAEDAATSSAGMIQSSFTVLLMALLMAMAFALW